MAKLKPMFSFLNRPTNTVSVFISFSLKGRHNKNTINMSGLPACYLEGLAEKMLPLLVPQQVHDHLLPILLLDHAQVALKCRRTRLVSSRHLHFVGTHLGTESSLLFIYQTSTSLVYANTLV